MAGVYENEWAHPSDCQTELISRWLLLIGTHLGKQVAVIMLLYSHPSTLHPQLIINVSRMLILELPWKQNGRPNGYITFLLIISPLKHRVQRLWRLIYCLLIMAMLVGLLMEIKDAGKVRNRWVAKSLFFSIPILILVRKFIPQQLIHGSRYCSMNNTNEWCLLVSMSF